MFGTAERCNQKRQTAMAARMNRRIFGMLSKRLDELGLDEIDDTRDDRGKRWRLGTLLRATSEPWSRAPRASPRSRI